MPPAALEPAIPAGERPQTYVLDRANTGIVRDSNPGLLTRSLVITAYTIPAAVLMDARA
jgi:hypothetical protein